ncbi:MAG: hypothetical protein NW224_20850 [Leptolyngbyaceae cyanobacterium bins.302]|nr:hypothetical protein [Leptolyngbyaceae cyanobacterium bins.302]
MILEIAIVIGWAVSLVWMVVSTRGLQRSLQWWQLRQTMKLTQEAETIRNGLLQESFVMRRSLELMRTPANPLMIDPNEQTNEQCLAMLEKFHLALKDLSDRLSPPYGEDNFPLAIQYLLEQWRSRFPSLTIRTTLPDDWQHNSDPHQRLVLLMLDELLHLGNSLETVNLHTIHITMNQNKTINQLSIGFEGEQLSTFMNSTKTRDWSYLRQTFQFITSGKCWFQSTPSQLIWHFQWQPKTLSDN